MLVCSSDAANDNTDLVNSFTLAGTSSYRYSKQLSTEQPISEYSSVEATVRYLSSSWRKRTELPRIFDRESRRANTERKSVSIHDARTWPTTLELNVNGFQLFNHMSEVTDFRDSEEVKSKYYSEIKDLLKKITSADEVYATQHLVRTEDTSDFNKAYARFLHCDYSMAAGYTSSFNLLKKNGRDPARYESANFAWYNSWQPIENIASRNPLAVLDASSIDTSDIVDYEYGGYGKRAKSSMPIWNPAHRLFYFSNMTPSEVMFIKQLDTREGCAHVSPHTSFDNPRSNPVDPPRRSIEVRLMCVFRD